MSTQVDRTAVEVGAEAYRAMYEHSPDGVMFTSPDGSVLAANPAACEILRRTEAEICALGRPGMTDRGDERWALLVAERDRTGRADGIARMIRGDGTLVEVEVSSRVFTTARGEARTCTVIRDVTERLAMERELRESRARLAEAERIAQIGSWEWDINGARAACSDGLLHIYGLSRDEFIPTLEGAAERIYPEDRERVTSTIANAIAERSSFAVEYRAVRADGRVRTLMGHGDVVVGDSGEPTRLIGVVQDVTDTKRAQEMLQRASADLERRAAELKQLALPDAHATAVPRAALTDRQHQIVQLIAQGLTNAEIGGRLYVAETTVKWHVRQILTKTGSTNRAEAIARVLGTTKTDGTPS